MLRLALDLGEDGAREVSASDFAERLFGREGAEDERVAADLHSAAGEQVADSGGEEWSG